MLRNILYATDLGLFGPFILEHVGELAKRHNARVTVVHAIEPVSIFADALLATYVPQESMSALREHGYEAVLATIRARVRQAFHEDFIDFSGSTDWIADVQVIGGDPAQVILDQAELSRADLIVMGSHGGRSSSQTAIGSVASKVLQLSRVPIYLVPTLSSHLPAVTL
ncbi:MAG: universal stress protein [Gammaproteobacteria bacterium]|nr:universal stress protein [Gammaproteobacteria bacterium]